MPALINELRNAFLCSGEKKVSKTDIAKDAYVLNHEQRLVMSKVGYQPGHYPEVSHIKLHALFSDEVFEVSYYEAVRAGSGRTPEQRMGRIKGLFEEGDQVFLATDGKKAFIHKIDDSDKDKAASDEKIKAKIERVYSQFDAQQLSKLAKAVKGRPRKKINKTTGFDRNLAVVAYTQMRSNYRCEVDSCSYEGFIKEDGAKYIEVHHLKPLADGGVDSIDNTASVCPNCHRKLHYGADKEKLAKELSGKVKVANRKYQAYLKSRSIS